MKIHTYICKETRWEIRITRKKIERRGKGMVEGKGGEGIGT